MINFRPMDDVRKFVNQFMFLRFVAVRMNHRELAKFLLRNTLFGQHD